MDFNQPTHRNQSASVKWDGIENIFGVTDALPMWVADMDFTAPPSVIHAFQERLTHGIFGYSLQTDSYFQAIIDWMKRRHQWQIDKDWIVYSPGVVPALSLIVQAFTEPGDKVIIQPPVYPPFYQVVENHDRELIQNPLRMVDGKYSMDLAQLESQIDDQVKMLILCSPHNPVGRVWTREELEPLAELCIRRNILVVSDEIHSDLLFNKGTHIPYALLSEEAKDLSIICTAPSKSFNIAGLHTSNIIIPNSEIRSKFKKTLQKYALDNISPFGLIATEAAYNEGEEWLDECLLYIRSNMEYVKQYIDTHIPELHVTLPEATYLLWIDFRELGMSTKDLTSFLLKEVKLIGNSGSSFGKEGDGFIRLNLGCQRTIVEEAMKRLNKAIQAWRNKA
ncbi:MalY/PatB family protein [Paenibacillus crassostreae]|uniref:cysteine-S-conjugate beta-lyase n=1 Tax=Paenibacillus crassostreae TaxID=1763538 RepID=A0A167GS61_9BACL|nr:MalY/PatB family protein [Paenibacillus crassostreae]AOZ92041.1 cystathionine beta-lyase [Paenibacillus crassostreae]OAB77850.1 cystathionine beta-lyase [Paenibacillus crassostreae]